MILAVYAALPNPRVRRAGAFALGGLVGLLPLLAYNVWAFNAVTHISYAGTISTADQQSPTLAQTVAQHSSSDWFWPLRPHLDVALQLLLSIGGWLVSSPVTAVAFAATILLFRRGFRAEALVVAAISLVLLLAISGFNGPWGGVPPGPRYLIPMLPFLGVPLALAFRELATVTSALAAASILVICTVTATRPQTAWDGNTFDRVWSSGLAGWSDTVADLAGITGWYDVLPLVAAVFCAVALAAVATPWSRPRGRELVAAAIAVVAWAALARGAWRILVNGELGEALGAAVVAALLLAVSLAVALVGLQREARRHVQLEATS